MRHYKICVDSQWMFWVKTGHRALEFWDTGCNLKVTHTSRYSSIGNHQDHPVDSFMSHLVIITLSSSMKTLMNRCASSRISWWPSDGHVIITSRIKINHCWEIIKLIPRNMMANWWDIIHLIIDVSQLPWDFGLTSFRGRNWVMVIVQIKSGM